MKNWTERKWAAGVGSALAALALAGGAEAACQGSGVITRIDGSPTDVSIQRTDGGKATQVSRPRVLEVLCAGDKVTVRGKSSLLLSIDGRGAVKVTPGQAYTVAGRSGAPSAVGNAYRAVGDQVMPDMKRLPWDVRLKGDDPLAFALAGLPEGGQKVSAGKRDLIVRVSGGKGPYRARLARADNVAFAQASADKGELVFKAADLTPGLHRITVSDGTGTVIEAEFTVVAEAAPATEDFGGLEDLEVRAAVTAAAMAKADRSWSFEAEQVMLAAPSNGLDRDWVYALIEAGE